MIKPFRLLFAEDEPLNLRELYAAELTRLRREEPGEVRQFKRQIMRILMLGSQSK